MLFGTDSSTIGSSLHGTSDISGKMENLILGSIDSVNGIHIRHGFNYC